MAGVLWLPLLLTSLISLTVQASTTVDAAAQDPQWLALGHYLSAGRGSDGLPHWQSEIDDRDFFLAANGDRSPRDELTASLAQAQNPLTRTAFACRFPARYTWLRQRLAPSLDTQLCEGFDNWTNGLKPVGVSLVFPAAYINSPSSMFGHTFLRIDGAGQTERTRLLAYSISYGAEVPKDENGFVYTWNGLTGGYPGFISGSEYYNKVIEYNDLDSRDIWEYSLSLKADERQRLLQHIWELQQVNFDYYFIDENCAYRLIALLDVARPSLAAKAQFRSHTIPADTVRYLRQHGLLGEVVYRPSALTELRHLIRQLDSESQHFAHQLAIGEAAMADLPIGWTPEEKAAVLDLAYDYLRYRVMKKQEPDAAESSRRSLALLSARAKLGHVDIQAVAPLPAPDQGHRSARFDLGLEAKQGRKTDLVVAIRPAFHDLLDAPEGFVAGAAINFLAVEGRIALDRPEVRVDQVQLLDIVAVPERNRFLKPVSWFVNTGWQRPITDDPLAFSLRGGSGGSWQWGSGLRTSLFVTGRLSSDRFLKDSWRAEPGARLLLNLSMAQQRQLLIDVEGWHTPQQRQAQAYQVKLGFNLPSNDRQNALRLSLHYNSVDEEVGAAVRWLRYF